MSDGIKMDVLHTLEKNFSAQLHATEDIPFPQSSVTAIKVSTVPEWSNNSKYPDHIDLPMKCRVCGDKASGFHYGVHSCEGCKGFFRRTYRMKLTYKPCPYLQTEPCKINVTTRNKCQYCRFQKCLMVGMSHDASRFGRMPREERIRLLEEIREEENDATEEDKHRAELRELTDRVHEAFSDIFKEKFTLLPHAKSTYRVKTEDGQENIEDTKPMQELTEAKDIAKYCTESLLAVVEGLAKFAKKLAEFRNLDLNDQVCLLRDAAFEIAMIATSSRYIADAMWFPLEGVYIKKQIMQDLDLVYLKDKVKFFEKIKKLNINERELALFSVLALAAPDRDDLAERGKVEKFQEVILEALEQELRQTHANHRILLPRLLHLLVDLRQLVLEHIQQVQKFMLMDDPQYPGPPPLLKEIYGL
ncbi:peroxisome proliferator-activated receptor alpha-like isoform X2 [Apostichopus japonicus]|uniref:peroxisome proliferator-activated receptor alpha-like isoform X2 n=1 Tax=Stichopus japonicus TaxID=307972 RepID=UPI003AB79186